MNAIPNLKRLVVDTYASLMSGLGTAKDKSSTGVYTFTKLTRDQLENAYRGDWIARKIVDIPPFDAVREWRAWQAEDDAIEKLEEAERALGVRNKLQEAECLARLYGGAALLMGVARGNPSLPLNIERIGAGDLKFIHAVPCHELKQGPPEKSLLSPWYGQPEYYEKAATDGQPSLRIHPSWLVRLIGRNTPVGTLMAQPEDWGDSVLDIVDDAVKSAGMVQGSIAALIHEAKFDVIKIPDLANILSTEEGTAGLTARFLYANTNKSIINAILMDKEEEWERISVAFAGMPDVLQMYLLIASGAADIPVTRMLGQSPAGMNATGESDIRNYYDRIHADQELRLRPALSPLDEVLIRHTLGSRDPSIWYEWRSLWQLSETEKSAIAKTKGETAKIDADSGLIPMSAMVTARQNQLIEDGTYPGLEAALEESEAAGELAAAVLPPPIDPEDPAAGGGGGGQQQQNAPAGGGGTVVPFARAAASNSRLWDAFEEQLHPRVNAGGIGGGQFMTKAELAAAVAKQAAIAQGAAKKTKPVVGFVSPNVRDLTFQEAQAEMASVRQQALLRTSEFIDHQLGIRSTDRSCIGAWADGAENSIMVQMPNTSMGMARVASAMKGSLADQKAVLVFEPGEGGRDYMAAWHVEAEHIGDVHDNLLANGVAFHTLEPTRDGTIVRVYGSDQETLDKIGAAANGAETEIIFGRGEFIGTEKSDGTDREQRDDAQEIYASVIQSAGKLQGRDINKIWRDARSHWKSLAKDARGGGGDVEDALPEFKEELHPRNLGGTGGGQFKTKSELEKAAVRQAMIAAMAARVRGEGHQEREAPDLDQAHPEVVNVGGDAWNKNTAARLELEYIEAKPALQSIVDNVSSGEIGGGDDEEENFVPEEWESLSNDAQEQTKEHWKENSKQEFLDSEIQNWHDNGDSGDDAARLIVSAHNDDPTESKWLIEALQAHIDERAEKGWKEIPYTAEQLAEAIEFGEYDGGNGSVQDPDIQWLDSALMSPKHAPPEGQETFPGIEPENIADRLTPEMRKDLEPIITSEFISKAEDDANSLDPPEHLADSIDEFQDESWEGKDDNVKFNYAFENKDSIGLDELTGGGSSTETIGISSDLKPDPLQATHGQRYRETQALARELFSKRAAQLLEERGIEFDASELRRVDNRLWQGWKASSTGEPGLLIQLATADELGGRIHEKIGKSQEDLDRGRIMQIAEDDYSSMGGYEGIKAMMRAKWEATQYMLDKAGAHTLTLYRGISMEPPRYDVSLVGGGSDNPMYRAYEHTPGEGATDLGDFKTEAEARAHVEKLKEPWKEVEDGGHMRMPNVHIARNGAASTSTDAGVSNGWGNDRSRVVLRIEVPRTAAISVPAFGQNIQSEHEVVIAGLAWKNWDAWRKTAPLFEKHPIGSAHAA